MTVLLINPNLVIQRGDPFTTGIVYMPIGLAYVAAALRRAEIAVRVVDAFGENPTQARRVGEKHLWLGLTADQVLERVPTDARIAMIYAINVANHDAIIHIVRALKSTRPDLSVVILENTQAVTAYALSEVRGSFFEVGVDFVLTGEAEENAVRLAQLILRGGSREECCLINGLASPDFYTPAGETIQSLDHLPFPAWDLFPLQNYWKLRFAHGPLTSERYLPLLTSRGCPYPCRFCVVPATNRRQWRARSAQNVVDEMEYWLCQYGVNEFHLEDLDPTVSDQRIRQICSEIMRRGLKVMWKLVAGTKVETMRDEETIDLMAQAGCRYISISPETGSPRLLKLMDKPFDLEHALRLVKRMNQVGIYSQACFILGFPGEDENDLGKTRELVHRLTRHGVDEIALFIISPLPGAAIYTDPGFIRPGDTGTSFSNADHQAFHSFSDLTFSPVWREDYRRLNRFRLKLYVHFLWWKLRYHPLKLLKQPFNFLCRRFETKMEMVPYRAMVYKFLEWKS